MHTTLYPNAFDRVFSVLINERDFMYKGTTATAGTADLQADKERYKSTPYYNLEGKQIISQGLNTESLDPGYTKYYERYNESLQEDSAEIYNYYCTVSILPRPEVEVLGDSAPVVANTALDVTDTATTNTATSPGATYVEGL